MGILKLLRIVFFLVLYFLACLFIAGATRELWTDGALSFFVLATPVLLVWWGERRRVARQRTKLTSTSREEPAPKSSKRVAANEAESLRSAETGSRKGGSSVHGKSDDGSLAEIASDRPASGAIETVPQQTAASAGYRSRQDNATLIQAAQATRENRALGLKPYWENRAEDRTLAEIADRSDERKPAVLIATVQAVLESKIAEGSSGAIAGERLPRPEERQGYRSRQDNAALVRAGQEMRERSKREAEISAARAVERPAPPPSIADRVKTLVPAPRRSGWIPKGETVVVSGRTIGGMIYVGTPPLVRNDYTREKCRAFIDPSLQVANRGTDRDGNQMPYWPGYSNIPASSRATYLDWLADGCRDASYDCGYMFLYFYGLERRFFVDAPNDAEKKEILAEVRRLQALYRDNHSVQRYLGEFVSVAETIAEAPENLDPIYDNPRWELPLALKMAIGAKFLADEPLSAEWLLSWFLCHPEKQLRMPAERCRPEFMALFKVRFSQRYPDGLKSRKPTRPLKETYRAASAEFTIEIEPKIDGQPVPDISGARKPVAIAQEIADEAMIELDKLSRFLGRDPDGRGTLEAHALMPSDLWPLFPSAALDELKGWVTGRVEAGGLVPAVDVVARLEGHRPDKLTKRQLTDSGDALARIGFGLAPDPRFALRGPKADEPVVLFELGEAVDRLEEVSPYYRVALIELALGTFIAHADGEIVADERRALERRIESLKTVSEAERKRLFANLSWLLSTPPDLPLLRRKLKELAPEHQKAFREIVVAIAHSDASIEATEVAGIEKIYKALGLDPSDVYSDIHSAGTRDGPVRVRRAEPGAPGEAIPDEIDERASAMPLDLSRIEAITKDTAEVSSVLGAIFADDLATDDEATAPNADASRFSGLDAKHAAFVEDLIAREHWSDEEFEALSRTHGLMASGALETINEWAFDNHGEALIDAYDGYDIEPEIAEALKSTPELEAA